MIEIEEKEKTVIAKPVACRPRLSNLACFSELLSGTSNASQPAAYSETAVAAIRPTTVRFKTLSNSDNIVEADVRDSTACNPSKKAPDSNSASNVVYKPIAKLVSKTTVSLLANLGGHDVTHTGEIAEAGACTQQSNQVNHQTESISEFPHDMPQQLEQKTNAVPENFEDDNKSLLHGNSKDRPSYDGHNWRKYGQKQVKGSEHPRSYYRCSYPSCPVKKKVEKTLDGQITEIVYKGEHNHSKPQPLPANDAMRKEVTNEQDDIAKDHEAAACNGGPSTSNNSFGQSVEREEVSEFFEVKGDDFKSKRTKRDNQLIKASTVGEASSEPQIVIPNNTDSSITGDGFRWRKYGQKVVKGKMYPRSYYRCTNPDCNVRKYVERTSEDPTAFITTYEGRHNHPMPLKLTKAEVSKTTPKNKT